MPLSSLPGRGTRVWWDAPMKTPRVLYLLGSAAPPVLQIDDAISDAQKEGWDVCLGLTPSAALWMTDRQPALEAQTGHPVRSHYKLPGQPDAWPPASVVAVAPATFNTINRWALGLTDHYVVGFAAEAVGKGLPLVTMPCANAAFVRHPQFEQSLAVLRGAGVRVLYGEDGFRPAPPGRSGPPDFPWRLVLDAVGEAAAGTA